MKFGQKAKVIGGFFEGLEGRIIDENFNPYALREYYIEGLIKNTPITKWIREDLIQLQGRIE